MTWYFRANAREVKIYDASNVEKVLGTALVGTSPSILAPFYDRDTGLIVLHGRGESYVQFLELSDSAVPQTVNRYEGGAAQQSLQLLPKRFCDVKNVEIFIGYRLIMGVIEKLSFTVPRLHKDHFQDDIYTATLDVENPVLSAEEWVEGKTPKFKWIDLRPTDMPLREHSLPSACKIRLISSHNHFVVSQRSTQATQEKKVISFVREMSEQERKDAVRTTCIMSETNYFAHGVYFRL